VAYLIYSRIFWYSNILELVLILFIVRSHNMTENIMGAPKVDLLASQLSLQLVFDELSHCKTALDPC
jgi:hypothetical protein